MTDVQPTADVIVGAPPRAGDKPDVADIVSTNEAMPTLAQLNVSANEQPIFAAQPTNEVATATPVVAAPILPPDGKHADGTDLDRGEKLLAGIGYIGILALVPLLLRRDSMYCRHHGSQGLVLGATLMLIEMFAQLIGLFAPGFHGFIVVLTLVAWIAGFALAFSGSWFRIPLIYDWSRELNLFAEKISKDERLKNEEDN